MHKHLPMKAFRILIAEDEVKTSRQIEQQLNQWGYEQVFIANSRGEAEQAFRAGKYDLTFINMDLSGDCGGIQLGRFIKSETPDHPIIYLVENLDQHQIELVKSTLPAGFLFKPIQVDLLHVNVEIVLHKYVNQRDNRDTISLSLGEGHHVLPVRNILYLEADHVYVRVYTSDGESILQRRSLGDLMDQLPAGQFVQTHRSFVVNIRQLNRWDKQYVYLNGHAVPLSRGRRRQVLAMLAGVVGRA